MPCSGFTSPQHGARRTHISYTVPTMLCALSHWSHSLTLSSALAACWCFCQSALHCHHSNSIFRHPHLTTCKCGDGHITKGKWRGVLQIDASQVMSAKQRQWHRGYLHTDSFVLCSVTLGMAKVFAHMPHPLFMQYYNLECLFSRMVCNRNIYILTSCLSAYCQTSRHINILFDRRWRDALGANTELQEYFCADYLRKGVQESYIIVATLRLLYGCEV